MAKAQICLSAFIIFLYISSEGSFMRVNASQGQWCVAKPGTDNNQLYQNIQFICSRMDCKIIYKGGACHTPDKPINQASVAMNLYYQAQGRRFTSCDFGASGVIGITDPSYGGCIYEFRK